MKEPKVKLKAIRRIPPICSEFWQLFGSGKSFRFIPRTFYLHPERRLIKVPGIFGVDKKLKINLCNVKEVREGFSTDNWIEFKCRQEQSGGDIAPDFYHFSIILKSTSPELVTIGRSLDLMTEKYADASLWIVTLRRLIRELAEVDSKVYLNQICSFDNSSSARKFEKFLIDSKSHFLEPLFCRYAIPGTNFIDSQGLQRFCQVEQNEARTLEECSQLIAEFNRLIHRGCYAIINQTLTESYLSRRAFYHLFESEEFAPLFDRSHRQVCQDMSQPMSHYFIASSHNSYLSGNQITSSSSYEMYRKILLNGCRCIEIDVWEDNQELVVYHGMTMTSKISFRGVLETISKVAFERSDYPVIISIENRCKREKNQARMTQMIRDIFGERLYTNPVDLDAEKELPSPEAMKGRIFIKGIENFSSSSSDDSDSDIEFEFKMNSLDCNNNDDGNHSDYEDTTTDLDCFDLKYFNIFANLKKNKQQQQLDRRKSSHAQLRPQQSVIKGDFDSDEDQAFDGPQQNILDELTQRQKRWLKRRRRPKRSGWKSPGGGSGHGNSTKGSKVLDPHKISRPESLLHCSLNRYNSAEIVNIEEIFSKCSISSEFNGSFSYLINYFRPRKFFSITDCLDNFQFNEMISRSEIASRQLTRDHLSEYRSFSRRNMVRVYPHAWRQDSSNYIPIDHWHAGAQMVALNYQQISMPMLINLAWFAQNGACGYVLKPKYLLNHLASSTNECIEEEANITRTILKIRIICGQLWGLFPVGRRKTGSSSKDTSLKVVVRIYSSLDKHRKSTKCIEKNAQNPTWNEEFTFKLKNPKLTFVQFTLVNKSTFVGHYVIALQAMQKGYRHISLQGHDLKVIKFCRLFLHVDYFNKEQ